MTAKSALHHKWPGLKKTKKIYERNYIKVYKITKHRNDKTQQICTCTLLYSKMKT